MNESRATTALLTELRKHGHFWKSSDRFQAGVPDIVGCYKGRFVGIEMKVDYNTPSAIQVYTMCEIVKHGGYAGVVTYSNRQKCWWILGNKYALSDVVTHILEKTAGGGNDLSVQD